MMQSVKGILFAFAMLLGLTACNQAGMEERAEVAHGAAATSDTAPQRGKAGGGGLQAMLAYEHNVDIVLPAKQIAPRQQAVQVSCTGGAFGDCVVLGVRQQGGDSPSAKVTLRLVPEGVEPMIALAGDGARVGSRNTHAEDLAVVVRDNRIARNRLGKELERLQAVLERRDLSVADMITLSERIAEIEAKLEAAEREGAQHRRRIDTQLLTLDFRPPGGQAGRSEIGLALRDVGGTLSMSTAWTIRALAFLTPLGVVLTVLILVIRRIRRRR